MAMEIPAGAAAGEAIHAWEAGGAASAEALTAWVSARLAAHESALAALLAVEGERTPENSLLLYDKAIEQLSLAGAQAGILNSVAADKAVRDQAQMEAQRVAMAGSALSLNREVYDALAAIKLDGASAATKHYVERTLLGLPAWPAWTRTRPRATACRRCTKRPRGLSLEFSRNIQEGGKTIEATPEELEGLPADYIARHPAEKDASGAERVTLTTDPPDMMPVMTFARARRCASACFWPTTRARIRRTGRFCSICWRRGRRLRAMLGFRSWADLATADQMMESAANVRTFLAKLDEASREGARHEHELVLEFARGRQPGLSEIDITSRGYWYEQFRRAQFDFDSQSVRPYFPYAQVEAGVLETAARLFKVEFRPSNAPAWDEAVSVFEVFDGGRLVGRFYLDMHPREGKDKWFSAAPVVTGVRGRALPEAALICNFPGGRRERSGASAVLRRGDVLPRVRPPDARDSRRAHGVGGAFGVCDGGRFYRGAVADAGGVFPRREAAAGVRASTTRRARCCPRS